MFDLYGTLVDPLAIAVELERSLPAETARRVAVGWRQTQLEYSFRLTVMGRYETFEWVTARALDRHAAATLWRPLAELRLISSNPFDVIGAQNVGMETAWLNRSGGLFDTVAEPPEITCATVIELAECL